MAKPFQIIKVSGDSFSAYDLVTKYKYLSDKIAVSFKIGRKRKLKKFRVVSCYPALDEFETNEMVLLRGDGTLEKRYFDDIVLFSDLV